MKSCLIISTLLVVVGASSAFGQPAKNDKPKQPVVQKQDDIEKAQIREAIDGYLLAINSGNAAAAIEFWSESGQWTFADGDKLVGKADILKELETFLNDDSNRKVEVLDVSIRILAPTVAIEEGEARIISGDAEPRNAKYVAIHVKQKNGEWKLGSLTESESVALPTSHEHLKELEWMIGDWVDQDGETTIETNCRWTSNGNFLTRSFKVSSTDFLHLEGTQVVGWDPKRKQIRSWVFDSDGGFGEGSWSRSGDQWTVKNRFQESDGREGRSTNMFKYIDDNSFEWQSQSRSLGDQKLPDIPAVVINRVN